LLFGRRAADQLHPRRDDAVLAAEIAIADRLRVARARGRAELALESGDVDSDGGFTRREIGHSGAMGPGARGYLPDPDMTASPQPPDDGWLRPSGALDSRLRRTLRLLRDRRERGGAADGELGEALAVEGDAGVLEAVHELTIGEPVLACGGIDAHDPQPAEV